VYNLTTAYHLLLTDSSVFGIGNEDEPGELLIDYKQTAKLIRIFVCTGKVILFVFCYQFALDKFIEKGRIVVPGQVHLSFANQELSDGNGIFGNGKNGVGKPGFADLVGGFLERVGHFHKILRNGAQVFSVKFGIVEQGEWNSTAKIKIVRLRDSV